MAHLLQTSTKVVIYHHTSAEGAMKVPFASTALLIGSGFPMFKACRDTYN